VKKTFLFFFFLSLIPTYSFSAETFHHDNRKITVEYLKRGDFDNHKIRIKGSLSGGRACREGILQIGVSGLGRYTTKRVGINNYHTHQFFKTSVTGPKSQPYGDVDIQSASFTCYQ
jgi:hypothetical protein